MMMHRGFGRGCWGRPFMGPRLVWSRLLGGFLLYRVWRNKEYRSGLVTFLMVLLILRFFFF